MQRLIPTWDGEKMIMTESHSFDRITLDRDGIWLDDYFLKGCRVQRGVHIHWGGDNRLPSITLTIPVVQSTDIEITDAAREYAAAEGAGMWTESGQPRERRWADCDDAE